MLLCTGAGDDVRQVLRFSVIRPAQVYFYIIRIWSTWRFSWRVFLKKLAAVFGPTQIRPSLTRGQAHDGRLRAF